MRDAYWTIWREGTNVFVWDEIKDRPIKRHSKCFGSEAQADNYIDNFQAKWQTEIAILERL